MVQRCVKLLIYELGNAHFEVFLFINNNINENGVLIHFTLKSRNEALLSKTLKNKILDSTFAG